MKHFEISECVDPKFRAKTIRLKIDLCMFFGNPFLRHRIGEFSNDFGQVIQLLAPWQRQVWMVGLMEISSSKKDVVCVFNTQS